VARHEADAFQDPRLVLADEVDVGGGEAELIGRRPDRQGQGPPAIVIGASSRGPGTGVKGTATSSFG
jgi:hypothetical protein